MTERPKLTPRKTPTQDRSRFTVDAMLTATAEVLLSSGFEAMNTNDIAERAGVSVGSVYQYFPNKESLISGLAVRSRREVLTTISDALLEGADGSLEELASGLSAALAELLADEAELWRALNALAPELQLARKLGPVESDLLELWQSFLESRGVADPGERAARAAVLHRSVDAVLEAGSGEGEGPAASAAAVRSVLRDLFVGLLRLSPDRR